MSRRQQRNYSQEFHEVVKEPYIQDMGSLKVDSESIEDMQQVLEEKL